MYFSPYDYNNNEAIENVEDWDDDLEKKYPPIYSKIYPWVSYFCCDMELKHGDDYEPTREEIKEITENIYEKIKDDLEDDDDKKDNKHRDDDRIPLQYGYGYSGGFVNDLIGIVLLNELVGRRDHRRRRPRRRRRRRPDYGYYPPYYGY